MNNVTTPRRRTGPWILGAVALFWLAAVILPATQPNRSASEYVGAAILAVLVAGLVVGGTSAARRRFASSDRVGLMAAPVLVEAVGSLVAGGIAVAVHGASPVLGDALGYGAELGVLATVLSVLPLPGSDGSRILHKIVSRRRGELAAGAFDAKAAQRTGLFLLVAGAALFAFVDVGLGLGALLIGWLSLGSGRLLGARANLAAKLQGRTVGDFVVESEPVAGWKPLGEALAARGVTVTVGAADVYPAGADAPAWGAPSQAAVSAGRGAAAGERDADPFAAPAYGETWVRPVAGPARPRWGAPRQNVSVLPPAARAIPVVGWSGQHEGVLLEAIAQRAMAAGQGDERVARFAIPAQLVPTAEVTAPAQALLDLLAGSAASVVVVTRDGVPVGAVTGADLQAATRR